MAPDNFDAGEPRAKEQRHVSIAPRPLLASEALKDDVAPVEPLRRSAALGALAGGAVFVALGFVPGSNSFGKPWTELVIGLVFAALGLAPLSYATRALGLLTAGLLLGLAGVGGVGPASVVQTAVGGWGVFSLLATVVLPAALLFRSHYRAYRGARLIVAAAIVLCAPFAVFSGIGLHGATRFIELSSLLALGALGLGLLGFMGSQAPLAGSALSATVITAFTSQIPAYAAYRRPPTSPFEWLSTFSSSMAFGVGCGVAAIGGFQLLAHRHWSRARSVEVHAPPNAVPAPAPSAPSLSDTWNDRR